MPVNRLPVLTQATPVEPLPIAKSSTVLPGLLYVHIKSSSNATGFWVG